MNVANEKLAQMTKTLAGSFIISSIFSITFIWLIADGDSMLTAILATVILSLFAVGASIFCVKSQSAINTEISSESDKLASKAAEVENLEKSVKDLGKYQGIADEKISLVQEMVLCINKFMEGDFQVSMTKEDNAKSTINRLREHMQNNISSEREAALMDKIMWHESVLDAMRFPVSVTDMNMNWTHVNKAIENIFNKSREDFIGKQCSNWGAKICKSESCGVACLRRGEQTTFFEQGDSNFSVDCNYLYDKKGQKIGHIEVVQDITAMVRAQEAEKKVVADIVGVTHTFSGAIERILGESEFLAESSVEQVAYMQALYSHISNMSIQATETNNTSKETAKLMHNVKNKAEKGTIQMDEMITSIDELNIASTSIQKVIKVIEDIAFQTNLLALNAAVEAARAGEYGKGFAVVAEEVRSLASRSSEAAKNSNELISNSLVKTDLCINIAKNTASSFADIVSDINATDKLVENIAHLSQEQTVAITSIHKDIEKVSDISQKNANTAKDSAATFSEQSSMLTSALDKFSNIG